jgi:hypothetical protein
VLKCILCRWLLFLNKTSLDLRVTVVYDEVEEEGVLVEGGNVSGGVVTGESVVCRMYNV